MRPLRTAGFRATVAMSSAGLLAAAGIIASAGPASAADVKIHATYPVNGSTVIKAANFTLPLGPGKLVSVADLNQDTLRANLKLPPATGTFNELGLVPITATTTFINDGPTTGTINGDTGAVATTSEITLKLSNVSVAGIPVSVGDNCETSTPVTVPVASDAGFNILTGGNLSGTYTIPQFANCGLTTAVINLTIPGSGNTITLTLGKAKIKQ